MEIIKIEFLVIMLYKQFRIYNSLRLKLISLIKIQFQLNDAVVIKNVLHIILIAFTEIFSNVICIYYRISFIVE